MRYLILSDMHGNWDAMEAVMGRVAEDRFDGILVLGDLVGYGASPNEIVDAVRGLPAPMWIVRGNHDKVVAGIDDGEHFNQAALSAARWTTRSLSEENLAYVEELPMGPTRITERLSICHGSPLDEDSYVFSEYDAFEIFASHPAPITFFGHTHVPSLFGVSDEGIDVQALPGAGTIQLDPESRYLINPGSIGQPRDRDPRAAFMIFNDETVTIQWERVPYPIDRAQEKILAAGLPRVLADRLAVGV